jgi:hypothetical protein
MRQYAFQRSGNRLQPPDMMLPANGRGLKASNIYSGGNLESGMLHGHHLIPEHKAHEAVHNYKTLHGLHSHHYHHQHLPHMHTHHIMEESLRGGFLPAGLLPLLAGAAMPLIGEAVKGLIGGFANQGGTNLANKLSGHGLRLGIPMVVHHKRGRHFHLHGEGFMDLIRSAMSKVKGIFTSQPARKLGHHALGALKEAFMHAISEKLDSLHKKWSERMLPTEAPATQGNYPEEPATLGEDVTEEAPRMTPADEVHEDITGTGFRRKRRAPPKKRAAPKRLRHAHHLPLY